MVDFTHCPSFVQSPANVRFPRYVDETIYSLRLEECADIPKNSKNM